MRGETRDGDPRGRRRLSAQRRSVACDEHGFTLIEILVVMAIIALVGQLVLVNLGSLVPSTMLDSEASQLMGKIEFLRSESQLQGKTYQLQLDLDEQQYRMILPPEERLVSEQNASEAVPLSWTPLDERVRFLSHTVVGGTTQRSGQVSLVFDSHGFTADQTIALALRADQYDEMIWTIQIRGLDRKSRLSRSEDGTVAQVTPAMEHEF